MTSSLYFGIIFAVFYSLMIILSSIHYMMHLTATRISENSVFVSLSITACVSYPVNFCMQAMFLYKNNNYL